MPEGSQCLDGPIRANRFADSRESLDSRESFQGSRTEHIFLRIALRGANIANHRFEAIRANRSHVMKIGHGFSANLFVRIDLRESPRFALRIAGPQCSWWTQMGQNGPFEAKWIWSNVNLRKPRVGRWTRGRWICVFGAPQIFAPNHSETSQNKGFGASGLKIGAPQKRRFNDHASNAPFSAL